MWLRRAIAVVLAHCSAIAAAVGTLTIIGVFGVVTGQTSGHDPLPFRIVYAVLAGGLSFIVGFGFAFVWALPATLACLPIALLLLRFDRSFARFCLIGGVTGVLIGLPLVRLVLLSDRSSSENNVFFGVLTEPSYGFISAAFFAGAALSATVWRKKALFVPAIAPRCDAGHETMG